MAAPEPVIKKKYKIVVPASKEEAREALGDDEEDFKEVPYSVEDSAREEGRELTRKILKFLKPPAPKERDSDSSPTSPL